jgi:hypothetical protein
VFEKEIPQKYILKMLLQYHCFVDGGSCGECGGGRLWEFRWRRRRGGGDNDDDDDANGLVAVKRMVIIDI